MKRVLLALALAGLGVGVAYAQPENLTDGVFITHYPPGSTYTNSDQCDWYTLMYSITSCDQQNPRIDIVQPTHAVWYVLAAWYSDKIFCGAEFGFGAYNGDLCWHSAFGPCPASTMVITSGVWPGPNAGVALAQANAWTGNYIPLYWFDTMAYYSDQPFVIPLTTNPGTGFGGFANCLTPPISYGAYAFGAMGFFTDGVPACPPAPTQHVCCVGEDCFLVFTEEECATMGGVFHAEWASCVDNPCYIPPTPHVCCVGHDCYLVLEQDCAAMEGAWHPEWDSCDDHPCDIYTPAEPSSWGAIKAIYR